MIHHLNYNLVVIQYQGWPEFIETVTRPNNLHNLSYALELVQLLGNSWRVNLQVEPVHGLGKVSEVELVLGEIPLFPRGR